MTRPLVLLLPIGFLLALVAGCTGHASQGAINFEVTGGFTGTGDGTPALRIEPDGTATRTSAGRTQTTRLDLATLHDLQAKIDAAQFPMLEPAYMGCADCYVYEVSVQLDGTMHRVAVDTDAHPPAALQAVIDALKDIEQLPLDWR
jgi:hypothetical protein